MFKKWTTVSVRKIKSFIKQYNFLVRRYEYEIFNIGTNVGRYLGMFCEKNLFKSRQAVKYLPIKYFTRRFFFILYLKCVIFLIMKKLFYKFIFSPKNFDKLMFVFLHTKYDKLLLYLR